MSTKLELYFWNRNIRKQFITKNSLNKALVKQTPRKLRTMTPGSHHEIKGVCNVCPCFFFRENNHEGKVLQTVWQDVFSVTPSHPIHTPTGKVVDITSIHQEMPILRVTERRHVPRERHAGTDVPPQRACRNKEGGMATALTHCHSDGVGFHTPYSNQEIEVLLRILLESY